MTVCPYLKKMPLTFNLREILFLYMRYFSKHCISLTIPSKKVLSTLDPMYVLQLEFCDDPWLVDLQGFFEHFSYPIY